MAITDILTLTPDFNLSESIQFLTNIDEAESGNEVRDALVDDGLREYKLQVSYISETTMNAIWDFYLNRQGAYDDFLIKVETGYQAINEDIGISDGATTRFTLHHFPVQTDAGFYPMNWNEPMSIWGLPSGFMCPGRFTKSLTPGNACCRRIWEIN